MAKGADHNTGIGNAGHIDAGTAHLINICSQVAGSQGHALEVVGTHADGDLATVVEKEVARRKIDKRLGSRQQQAA